MTNTAPATPAQTGAVTAPPAPVALRAIAAWLESHPEFGTYEIVFPRYGSEYFEVRNYSCHSAAKVAETVRACGGRWEKVAGDDNSLLFTFQQEIAPLVFAAISTGRENVCQRVVVDTKTVTLPAEPALPARPERTEVVEIAEWRCAPILAAAGAEAEAA